MRDKDMARLWCALVELERSRPDIALSSALALVRQTPPGMEVILPDAAGDHLSREEFLACVRSGGFIDYDGSGNLATASHESDVSIQPSETEGFDWPDWATHVVWYNR